VNDSCRAAHSLKQKLRVPFLYDKPRLDVRCPSADGNAPPPYPSCIPGVKRVYVEDASGEEILVSIDMDACATPRDVRKAVAREAKNVVDLVVRRSHLRSHPRSHQAFHQAFHTKHFTPRIHTKHSHRTRVPRLATCARPWRGKLKTSSTWWCAVHSCAHSLQAFSHQATITLGNVNSQEAAGASCVSPQPFHAYVCPHPLLTAPTARVCTWQADPQALDLYLEGMVMIRL
jgi:hypothetical protein